MTVTTNSEIKNFSNAIYFYTEGIKVDCKDDELKANLYCNRATAHFNVGEKFRSFRPFLSVHSFSSVFFLSFLFAVYVLKKIYATFPCQFNNNSHFFAFKSLRDEKRRSGRIL